MEISVKTMLSEYSIVLERGALNRMGDLLDLNRKVLIVTDDGVPESYSKIVANASKIPVVVTVPQGEKSKNIDTLQMILKSMVENDFTRSDCVVAVGGGVVGDMAGFAAAIFMRGIDFYNIPTTVLSQVDSSIGGKTAIDFLGYKNLIGSFYQPKKVVIDPETLKTLPQRQISNGLAESLKMALTSDAKLFKIFEEQDVSQDDVIDKIIERSLLIKKEVVEKDEREGGLRKILNFGHTLAHAIESTNEMEKYYHGECVAIGMIPMCSDEIKQRVLSVLKKLNLPTSLEETAVQLIDACKHDKKAFGENITIITVEKIGEFKMKNISFLQFENIVKKVAK
jgi:3-dehydroquinate synthase